MNKKLLWPIALIIVVVIVLALRRSSNGVSIKHITIGVPLALSGGISVTGEKIRQGIDLAQTDLKDESVEFVIQDTHSKAADALSAAKQMMDIDHVDLFIGPYSPDETIALSPVALKAGKEIFSLSYCSSSFKPLANVHCAYPTASVQLETLMPIFKAKSVKTVALVDSNTDFGIDSAKTMNDMAATNGYKILYEELSKDGERNFRTSVSKILALKADAVFMASDNPTDSLTLIKQLNEAGYKGVRVTFIDVDNKNLEGFGSSVDGTYAPGIAPSKFSKEFTDLYEAAYQKDPDYTSAMAWDVAHYVVQTLEKNDWNTSSLGTDVATTEYKDPAIANFKYLPDRTISYDLDVNIVKDGKYVTLIDNK